MPLRASCSFQPIQRVLTGAWNVISLNAPQGFMLIPTDWMRVMGDAVTVRVLMPLRASCSFQRNQALTSSTHYLLSLNAPQGFMLIPTSIIAGLSIIKERKSLNAPQGFMLIPTPLIFSLSFVPLGV